jgi:transcriptional regulator with XRE-family HTH domain
MDQTKSQFIAAEIRAELGRQSKTNAWLASELDVSEMWVSRRLRADQVQEISDEELGRIAEALGVPVATFLPTEARAA